MGAKYSILVEICGLRNSLSHWTVGTCISLCQPAKQITKKAAGRVSVVASPTPKLDLYHLLFKIESFEPFFHTLFRVVASFYQGGRGSTLHGKWMISFQIGRRRWRISCGRKLILPFRRERGENVGRIFRMQDPKGVCPS